MTEFLSISVTKSTETTVEIIFFPMSNMKKPEQNKCFGHTVLHTNLKLQKLAE